MSIFSIACGEPAIKLRYIVSAPNGSTPNTWQSGFASLIAVERPAARPPPPIGTITASRSGTCSMNSSPSVAGARRREQPFEWVDQRPPFFFPDFVDASERGHENRARARSPPPKRRHSATRNGLAPTFITTLALVADCLGGKSCRNRVIARADRADSPGALLGTQGKRVYQRATRLEAAGALEKLQLQDCAGARQQRGFDRRTRAAAGRASAGCGRRAGSGLRGSARATVAAWTPARHSWWRILSDSLQSACYRTAKDPSSDHAFQAIRGSAYWPQPVGAPRKRRGIGESGAPPA